MKLTNPCGGIDFKVSKHVSVHPVQAEYFMTKVSDGLNNRQNNFIDMSAPLTLKRVSTMYVPTQRDALYP